MTDFTPPLLPDDVVQKFRTGAEEKMAEQLRSMTSEYGIQATTAMMIGFVEAMKAWSEEVVGMSIADALAQEKRP
uniref:Uncharacterized protein n=1 Tax=Bosea sp. NBC_00436 TaxID=2969620 RepID=A0A9E8CSA2_9HYPH